MTRYLDDQIAAYLHKGLDRLEKDLERLTGLTQKEQRADRQVEK